MDLISLVINYKENIIQIAETLGKAKYQGKRKEYKELVETSGLSKDQVSLSLKRFALLQDGFSQDILLDYSDRMLKKVTNKAVTTNPELMVARKELGNGDMSYEEFCELIDRYKVVKTDDEKAIAKAEGLMKFVDKSNLEAETMMQLAEIVKPLNEYCGGEEDGD